MIHAYIGFRLIAEVHQRLLWDNLVQVNEPNGLRAAPQPSSLVMPICP